MHGWRVLMNMRLPHLVRDFPAAACIAKVPDPEPLALAAMNFKGSGI